MSLDYTVYFGPYVECKTSKAPVRQKRRGCLNVNCEMFRVHVPISNLADIPVKYYCSLCGSAIKEFTIEKMVEQPDYADWDEREDEPYQSIMAKFQPLCGDYIESLMNERRIHVWIPNDVGVFFDPRRDIDIRQVDLEKLANDQEIDLNLLTQVYGDENVSIKWGVVNYAN